MYYCLHYCSCHLLYFALVSVLTLCFLPEEESLAKVAKVEIPSVPIGAAVPRPYGMVYQPQQVPGAVRPMYVHYILCFAVTCRILGCCLCFLHNLIHSYFFRFLVLKFDQI